jgi:hypothetical protein
MHRHGGECLEAVPEQAHPGSLRLE